MENVIKSMVEGFEKKGEERVVVSLRLRKEASAYLEKLAKKYDRRKSIMACELLENMLMLCMGYEDTKQKIEDVKKKVEVKK